MGPGESWWQSWRRYGCCVAGKPRMGRRSLEAFDKGREGPFACISSWTSRWSEPHPRLYTYSGMTVDSTVDGKEALEAFDQSQGGPSCASSWTSRCVYRMVRLELLYSDTTVQYVVAFYQRLCRCSGASS